MSKKRKMSESIKNLDHLGLVAGIIDEIGIVKKINELIGEKETEKVSAGLVVKAMILNGMGLVSCPLYLFIVSLSNLPGVLKLWD